MINDLLKDLIADEAIDDFVLDDLDILTEDLYDDIKVSPEMEAKIAGLLHVHKDAIQEIIQVEPKIYAVTIETNEDEFSTFSYSEVDDSIYLIPDEDKFPKKQFLTQEEKTQYYLENKRLISYALKKISRPDGIEYAELEDVGTFGFVKALNTYDKANGTRFSTYAVKCVLNEVFYYLRKEQRHLSMVDSLDKEVATDNNGNSLTIGDTVSESISSKEILTEQTMLLDELRHTLLTCIEELQDDEQYLIIYRYGLDNNIVKTQTDIANTLNMSQANISKLEKTCLKKLRTILKKNNYGYDQKDKKLYANEVPLDELFKSDITEVYVDRDSIANIESMICSLLNLDVEDIADVKPTPVDHAFLVTFTMNNRVGVVYNNIVNKYEYTAIPLSRRDKFLYMVYGISLKTNFTKDDLLNPVYNLEVSDKEFKKLMKSIDKTKQYIMTYKYGLFDKDCKTLSEIAKDLKISTTEAYRLDREAMKELREHVYAVEDEDEE